MDALSDLLRVVGLTGGVFMDAEFTEPWLVSGFVGPEACSAFMAPPEKVIAFHYVIEGGFGVELPDGTRIAVGSGEAILLPHNNLHLFGTDFALDAAAAGALVQQPGALSIARIQHGGGGAATRMICGFMGGSANLAPVLSGLPDFLLIPLSELPSGQWIGQTFTHAAAMLRRGVAGTQASLSKVSELLFIEALRHHMEAMPDDQLGWLAAVRDPAIGRTLALIHTQLDLPWTTGRLAKEAGMSRSAFADRFTALVGMPPMGYVINWRMQVAQQKLRDTNLAIIQVALATGYDSEAAFSRAFKREVGVPPASWRKQAQ